MNRTARGVLAVVFAISAVAVTCPAVLGQQPAILDQDSVARLTPNNFYFEGQLGPTQLRNAAAIELKKGRHFVAALVDTSGYASNVRAKYEGFLITDDPVTVGGLELKPGAYGFGISEQQKLNIFDVGGGLLHAVSALKDDKIPNPRPLTIIRSGKDLRLYRGRIYVVIAAK
jgi:hypothetical protein